MSVHNSNPSGSFLQFCAEGVETSLDRGGSPSREVMMSLGSWFRSGAPRGILGSSTCAQAVEGVVPASQLDVRDGMLLVGM